MGSLAGGFLPALPREHLQGRASARTRPGPNGLGSTGWGMDSQAVVVVPSVWSKTNFKTHRLRSLLPEFSKRNKFSYWFSGSQHWQGDEARRGRGRSAQEWSSVSGVGVVGPALSRAESLFRGNEEGHLLFFSIQLYFHINYLFLVILYYFYLYSSYYNHH